MFSSESYVPSIAARLAGKRLKRLQTEAWTSQYKSAQSGKVYEPHNDDERVFVYDDVPRCALLAGGWGAGKSACGAVKSFERLRRGMTGIAVSPEFEHFRVSLWPVIREWCPWEQVVASQQRRRVAEWEPAKPFSLTFRNGTKLYCGGIKDATAWYGGNVHFALFDEAARYEDASAFKTLIGRARLTGPHGEPPQVFLTTTPAMNWLWEYFGPLHPEGNDPLASFKRSAFVGKVRTEENLANLDPEYVRTVRASLTEAEANQYLEAEWENVSAISKFVNMVWWDNCHESLPPLSRSEPLVIAADAATGGQTHTADTFAVVAVSRHPSRPDDVAVRYCGIWLPPPGGLLDFLPIEEELRRLCREFSVIEVAYDKTQLHDMMTRLAREGVALTREFPQGADRLVADKQLLDLILGRRVAHDGNPLLRQHVDNADVKKEGREGMRIVKRAESLKVDACVALSMSAFRLLKYVA